MKQYERDRIKAQAFDLIASGIQAETFSLEHMRGVIAMALYMANAEETTQEAENEPQSEENAKAEEVDETEKEEPKTEKKGKRRPLDHAELERMYEAGVPVGKMAEQLGCTKTTIYTYASENSLVRPKKSKPKGEEESTEGD